MISTQVRSQSGISPLRKVGIVGLTLLTGAIGNTRSMGQNAERAAPSKPSRDVVRLGTVSGEPLDLKLASLGGSREHFTESRKAFTKEPTEKHKIDRGPETKGAQDDTKAEPETRLVKRKQFGFGWLGDSICYGLAVLVDAAALMYSRAPRLLQGADARREEHSLRKKIGILHVLAPVPLFTLGYFFVDTLFSTHSFVGKMVLTPLLAVSGAVMYAFSNNIVPMNNGTASSESKGVFANILGGVESVVDKFGKWLVNKMPSTSWALAMGVSVDAVISGLKFVQSAGWSVAEVGSCFLIGGAVVYAGISLGQEGGRRRIAGILEKTKDTDSNSEEASKAAVKLANMFARYDVAGFLAFRYFAWVGFLGAAAAATGFTPGEWTFRIGTLATAVFQGWPRVRGVWGPLVQKKLETASNFVNGRVKEIEKA